MSSIRAPKRRIKRGAIYNKDGEKEGSKKKGEINVQKS